MKIAVGSDEKTETQEIILNYLQDNGFQFETFGALKEGEDDSWISVAEKIADEVASGRFDQGILCCWTGTGVSIVANKTKGIRAALCFEKGVAEGARKWNDANILVLSNGFTPKEKIIEILDGWLNSEPSEEASDKLEMDKMSQL